MSRSSAGSGFDRDAHLVADRALCFGLAAGELPVEAIRAGVELVRERVVVDAVFAALGAVGVDTRCYYDPPVHRQQAYRQFVLPETSLPDTEWLASTSLSLPLGPQVNDVGIERIANVFRQVQGNRTRVSFPLTAQ